MNQSSPHYLQCVSSLRQSPLFANVDSALLEDMLKIFRYETRVKNDTAFSPRQASDWLYLVVSGRAKVSVYNSKTGREHILFLLKTGDGFDLITLLDGDWHEAVATALDDMEVLVTSVHQAREWLALHPDFNRSFLPYLGKQLHMLVDQAVDLSLFDTEARLSRLILRNLVDGDSPHDVALINDLSQETLASMIGSVRVVVTRHLQKWKRTKIISGKRGDITVLDLQAMLKKAEQSLLD